MQAKYSVQVGNTLQEDGSTRAPPPQPAEESLVGKEAGGSVKLPIPPQVPVVLESDVEVRILQQQVTLCSPGAPGRSLQSHVESCDVL